MIRFEEIGIKGYLTETEGTGGKLREKPEDFYVEEILDVPENENGKYIYLHIEARNWETNRIVRELSRRLGISRKRITFSGTKDKRAVKRQYLCINADIDVDILKKIPDIRIIRVFRSDVYLKLGMHKWNLFDIRISGSESMGELAERTHAIIMEKNGFPNFFGVQRFGATRPVTHIVGKYILRREYDEAVRYYVGYGAEQFRKEFFSTMDPHIIREFPRELSYERAILNALLNGKDYREALLSLPQNLFTMFIHAYASYVFNNLLSHRMASLTPEIGDMVMEMKAGKPSPEKVHRVTALNRELINNAYTEGSVVLALPVIGYDVHGDSEEIEDIISADGVSITDFRLRDFYKSGTRGIWRAAQVAPVDPTFLNDECVRVKFKLPPGSYATSYMREIMKVDDLRVY